MGEQLLGASIDVTDDQNRPGPKLDMRKERKRAGARDRTNPHGLDEADTEPTLVAYFSKNRATPATFFKTLKKHEVKRFHVSDQDAAANLMLTKDPDVERLWELVSQATLPEPVDAWIWGAAQSRLKEHLGDNFEPQDNDPERIFKFVLRKLSPGLTSETKEDAKRTENLLRLAICWLVEKRALKPWYVARQLRSIVFKDLRGPLDVAQQAVQRGKASDLRLAAAMAALGDRMVQAAEEEQSRERDISTNLRHRLDGANAQITQLSSDLATAKTTISGQEATIAELKQTLADERQHWGHDLIETKAVQRALLGERLGPLLSDAIDALEIEPPAPGTALRRVKAALLAIHEAKE
jgi:hypothetical protein